MSQNSIDQLHSNRVRSHRRSTSPVYMTVQKLVRLSGKVFWDLDADGAPGFSEGLQTQLLILQEIMIVNKSPPVIADNGHLPALIEHLEHYSREDRIRHAERNCRTRRNITHRGY